jgi:predicted house-cleaning noncanonical NTP pyrophosphatase (MazG superfamily)
VSRTVVRAEDSDEYQSKIAKLQKEAEERLDDKVEELMKNIETVGQN